MRPNEMLTHSDYYFFHAHTHTQKNNSILKMCDYKIRKYKLQIAVAWQQING